ncbi:MAG: HPP family protein [Chloroflexota bacterium]
MQLTVRQLSAIVLVPAILVVADVLSGRTLKFLLLPPFGALTYLVFINPVAVELNVRRIIVAPSVSGLYAWLIAQYLGYQPLSIFLATAGTMVILWLTKSTMIVPPLALELLTLLLHQEVHNRFGYVVSVVVFTIGVYLIYLAWRRLPLDATIYPFGRKPTVEERQT